MYTVQDDELKEVESLEEFRYMGRSWFIFEGRRHLKYVTDKDTGAALHPAYAQTRVEAKRFLKKMGKEKIDAAVSTTIKHLESVGIAFPVNPADQGESYA